jgi:hypothetical protein
MKWPISRMGSSPPVFQGPWKGLWGIGGPFVTIFAAFDRLVTPLPGAAGTFFFHQRLAFTAS